MFITLTELRYLIAVSRELHFGRAAEKCFVSQPTLSIAIKKLEENLQVQIFERNKSQVIITEAGLEIIVLAKQVMESINKIEDFALRNQDQFLTPLKIGAIHTVGPYLFPDLITKINQVESPLKLVIEEDMTANLSEKLIKGDLDAIIVAQPFMRPNIILSHLYYEPLDIILPINHILNKRKTISPEELDDQTLLLLGEGHCFRDHVLQICPQCTFTASFGSPHTIITNSIETIKYMVANKIGISIVPRRSLHRINNASIKVKPFTKPIPQREIILAYRNHFSRNKAISELINLIQQL